MTDHWEQRSTRKRTDHSEQGCESIGSGVGKGVGKGAPDVNGFGVGACVAAGVGACVGAGVGKKHFPTR